MTRLFFNPFSRSKKRRSRSAKNRVTRRQQSLGAEKLESRIVFAVAITVDYTYDTQNFFANTEAREALEDVAAIISNHLNDTFEAIIPSGVNTWSQEFFSPGDGTPQSVRDPTVAANEYVVYAGGRDLVGDDLGFGGFGGFTSFGTAAWNATVSQRGESGVATNTDFASWGGTITFDSVGANWHFGESTSGLDADENDFRSVAYHELFHALGFGAAGSWNAQIVNGEFAGPLSVAEFDGSGNVPLHDDLAHFADGTTDGGQEVSQDPSLFTGTRKLPTRLDWASLADIGWEVTNPVYFDGADLIVDGTDNAEIIRVNDVSGDLEIEFDGIDFGTWPAPANRLIVNANGGNDEVRFQTNVTTATTIYGGDGNDRLFAGAGADELFGGAGNDELFGRDGDDVLYGEIGADRVFGMNGNDILFGGDANDLLSGGAGDDELNGDAGQDNLVGSTGADTLRGGDDDDTLNSGPGDDFLFGDAGNDTIRGHNGNDMIEGGAGDDTVFGGFGNDTIHGQDGVDTISGNADNDDIFGGAGNDVLNGGSGDDTIEGGIGNDTIDGATGVDTILGQAGNDILNGGSGNDFIFGDTGIDTINGSAGDDMIFGQAGGDIIIGGSGVDFIDGGDGDDDINGSSDNDEILGGEGNDTINGGGGNDDLKGGDGDDDLFGSVGDDTLTGEAGLDLLHGGSGTDTAVDTGERGEIQIEI